MNPDSISGIPIMAISVCIARVTCMSLRLLPIGCPGMLQVISWARLKHRDPGSVGSECNYV
jgi:hypothetical protein